MQDNDNDGVANCADGDCATDPSCTGQQPAEEQQTPCTADDECSNGETCTNGFCSTLSILGGTCTGQGGTICDNECGDYSSILEGTTDVEPTQVCCTGTIDPITNEALGPNCGPPSPTMGTCAGYDDLGAGTISCTGICTGQGTQDLEELLQQSPEIEGELIDAPGEENKCCVGTEPTETLCQTQDFIPALGSSVTVTRTTCIDEDGDGEGYSIVTVTSGDPVEYFTAIGIPQENLEADESYHETCTKLPKGNKPGQVIPFFDYLSLFFTSLILFVYYYRRKF